jgi:hypothetical protein
MRLKPILGAVIFFCLILGPIATGAAEVDAALVIGIDVSGSVNQERFELQRRGAAEAFSSAAFIEAVSRGRHHAIAVAVFEWSSVGEQEVIVPWTTIQTAEETQVLVAQLLNARRAFQGSTAVGDAILFGTDLLAAAPSAERQVIDISGDGHGNAGRPASIARERALAAGIVVNGLPILDVELGLEEWYRENVQGGEGSFTIPARSISDFRDALLAKLVREIS